MAKKIKEVANQLKFEDLKVRNVYRGKKPKVIGVFSRDIDDRDIIYISQHKSIIEHVDHGYTPEYEAWCKEKTYPTRYLHNISDQAEYEAKTDKPCKNIETIWDYIVQYDSPSVKNGKNYPKIAASKFLKWAAENITDKMPANGDWSNTL